MKRLILALFLMAAAAADSKKTMEQHVSNHDQYMHTSLASSFGLDDIGPMDTKNRRRKPMMTLLDLFSYCIAISDALAHSGMICVRGNLAQTRFPTDFPFTREQFHK